MYKRILVPLDGSEFSEEILPSVVSLSAVHGTPLVLLRIAPEGADQTAVQGYLDRLAVRHDAESLCLVNDGDIVDTILQETERVPDTLVAMTSHGRSGLVEAVMGSVAKEVVRRSGAPMLLWHSGNQRPVAPKRINSVVLPLDGRPLSEGMAPYAAQFAKWVDVDLLVVSVINPKDLSNVAGERADDSGLSTMESSYVRSRALELADKYGVRVSWDVMYSEHPAEAIAAYTQNRPVMLAMATRGQKAMRSAMLGSVTASLLRKGGVPMLIKAASQEF